MRISKYLQTQKNILVGGHYQWPDIPDEHAQESIKIIDRLYQTNKSFISYIFIDDIGASTMCISKCGMRKALEVISLKEDEAVVQWIMHNTKRLEEAVVFRNDQQIIKMFYEVLEFLPTKVIVEKFTPMELVFNFEKIIYAYLKSMARPFLLEYMLQKKLPTLIFEKSINNLTSKRLHQLKKRDHQYLKIVQKNSVCKYIVSDYISEEEILLREEICKNTKVIKAANRCSALLSTFFDKLIKDNITNEESVTIFYIIPEHDKVRLQSGVICFFSLYVDIYKQKYRLRNITVITSILQETMLLNIYKYDLKEDQYTHTIVREDYV